MTVIAITMAGRGQRFRDAGYNCPKYEIPVHDMTLFEWSMTSLQNIANAESEWIFVCRAEDEAGLFIMDKGIDLGIQDFSVINLDDVTDGQATSALYAANAAEDQDSPFLVYNIDTFVNPDQLHMPDPMPDGWIPCVQAEGDHWSFVAADEYRMAIEVREKERISPYATIGLYAFQSARHYSDLYHDHFAHHPSEKGERYIAPMYNSLIAQGAKVLMEDLPLDALFPLGKPDEVDRFAKHPAPIQPKTR